MADVDGWADSAVSVLSSDDEAVSAVATRVNNEAGITELTVETV